MTRGIRILEHAIAFTQIHDPIVGRRSIALAGGVVVYAQMWFVEPHPGQHKRHPRISEIGIQDEDSPIFKLSVRNRSKLPLHAIDVPLFDRSCKLRVHRPLKEHRRRRDAGNENGARDQHSLGSGTQTRSARRVAARDDERGKRGRRKRVRNVENKQSSPLDE